MTRVPPLFVLLGGCAGIVSTGGNTTGTVSPQEQAAIDAWTSMAMPALAAGGCVGCHEGRYPTVAFLEADNDADRRTVLLAYQPQVVNLDDPAGSLVLTKGKHEGDPLTAAQSEAILEWIQAEKTAAEAASPPTIIETAPFFVRLCANGSGCTVNRVALDGLGLTGAAIEFEAQAVGTNLYLTDLYADAATDGMYLEHPLFTSYPSGSAPLPDRFDRFYDVKLDLAPSTSAHIGAGEAVFDGFDPTAQLAIAFQALGPYESGGTTTPPTGCDAAGLASFVANVVPLMNASAAQNCNGCHGVAGSTAANAMPLLDKNGNPGLTSTTDNTACLSVRQHVNFQDPANSGLLLAPDPSSDDNHTFKLSATSTPSLASFQTGVTTWIAVEQSGQ